MDFLFLDTQRIREYEGVISVTSKVSSPCRLTSNSRICQCNISRHLPNHICGGIHHKIHKPGKQNYINHVDDLFQEGGGGGILYEALSSSNLCDLSALMVTSNKGYSIWIPHLHEPCICSQMN